MLYVGMKQYEGDRFQFSDRRHDREGSDHTSAALIFFGVFAAGVLAGTMLHSAQRPKRQEKQGSKEK